MIEMQELEITNEPWMEFGQFDARQRGLIHSCRQYVTDGAPGLPGCCCWPRAGCTRPRATRRGLSV